MSGLCRCGDTRHAHTHFNWLTHCALCPCTRYRRWWLWWLRT